MGNTSTKQSLTKPLYHNNVSFQSLEASASAAPFQQTSSSMVLIRSLCSDCWSHLLNKKEGEAPSDIYHHHIASDSSYKPITGNLHVPHASMITPNNMNPVTDELKSPVKTVEMYERSPCKVEVAEQKEAFKVAEKSYNSNSYVKLQEVEQQEPEKAIESAKSPVKLLDKGSKESVIYEESRSSISTDDQTLSSSEGRSSIQESEDISLAQITTSSDEAAKEVNLTNDNQRFVEDSLYDQWMASAHQCVELVKDYTGKELAGFDRIYQEKKMPHDLNVYFKSYTTAQNNKVNITRCEWYVPCTPEQFIKFMHNYEEQCKLGKNVDVYTLIDNFNETEEQKYTLYYLAYQKILTASPRDFVYLKNFKKLDEHTWIDCSKSVEHQDHPEVKEKTRGEMILCGHFVVRDDDPSTGQSRSKVKYYSECDFKTSVPDFMAKGFATTAVKQLVERCIDRIKELHPQ